MFARRVARTRIKDVNITDAEDINTFDTFSLALVLGLLDIIPKYDGIHPAAAILRPDF